MSQSCEMMTSLAVGSRSLGRVPGSNNSRGRTAPCLQSELCRLNVPAKQTPQVRGPISRSSSEAEVVVRRPLLFRLASIDNAQAALARCFSYCLSARHILHRRFYASQRLTDGRLLQLLP